MISDSSWSWWSVVISKKWELAFLAITLLTIYLYRAWKSMPCLPPGPRGLPVLGSLPFLGPSLHHEFAKIAQHFGPIFKLRLGCKTYIIVSSSDLAKVVVRDQDDVFANRNPPVAGLILSYGGKDITWADNNLYLRKVRKMFVAELMSTKNLEASLSFRRSGVRKTIKHLYETLRTEVAIGETAFSTSLNIITSILWGKDLDDYEQINTLGDGFRELILGVMELAGAPNVSDFFPMLTRFDLQGVQRKMKLQFLKFDRILQKIIDDRVIDNHKESTQKHGRKDFLQVLLELKQQDDASSFSIMQIKALLMDFFIAATDTTTTITEWTMAELLKNPEVMKNIQDELEQVVGLNNIVEESHLPKLRYLDATIKETFRLHPALPLLVGRCPSKSCKIDRFTIPKGSNVYLNVWAIHRDPQYWENPLEFDPNRFLHPVPDGTTKFDYNGLNTNFLAFGSGRRRCPGIPLGEKMLVYLLASMLHSFNWSLPNGTKLEMSDKFGVVLKKRNPLIAIPSQRLGDKNLYL